jgi:hypothetical protein
MDRRQLEAWLKEGLSLEQMGVLVNRDPGNCRLLGEEAWSGREWPGEARASRWDQQRSARAVTGPRDDSACDFGRVDR